MSARKLLAHESKTVRNRNTDLVPLNVYVTKEQKDKLFWRAQTEGKSMNEVVRELLYGLP